jgi:hypothetical protein
LTCSLININCNSSSERKILPFENLNLQAVMKNIWEDIKDTLVGFYFCSTGAQT